TYQTQPGSEGEYTFIGGAEGGPSGNPVRAVEFTSPDKLTIQRPPNLVVDKIEFKTPTGPRAGTLTISEGQPFDVVVKVKNNGEATATEVRVDLKSSIPEKFSEKTATSAQDLPGGGERELTFSYNTIERQSASTPRFTATPSGKDKNSGKSLPGDRLQSGTSAALTIQKPFAPVVASIQFKKKGSTKDWANTLTISEGQSFNVRVTVRNDGEAAGDGVSVELTPSPKNVNPVPPLPSVISVPGGGSGELLFEYTGQSASVLVFRAIASGTDRNSQGKVDSSAQDSQNLTIQTPPALSPALTVVDEKGNPILESGIISTGQTVFFRVTVTNRGQAPAQSVRPNLQIAVNGNVIDLTDPTEGNPIEGGGSATFESPDGWKYTAQAADADKNLTVSVTVDGEDANYEVAVPESAVTARAETTRPIKRVAVLVDERIVFEPLQVSEGQELTVTMTVRNIGGADALNVEPILRTEPAVGSLGPIGDPRPLRANIPAGGQTEYRWTYRSGAGSARTYRFIGSAKGIDQPSQREVRSPELTSANTLTVQTPAVLSIDSVQFRKLGSTDGWQDTLTITEGMGFEVRMIARNTGEADTVTVQPTLTPSLPGKVTVVLPLPAPVTVRNGVPHEFIWRYSTSAGSNARLRFDGQVEGVDANNSRRPTSDKRTSGDLVIQTPPEFVVTLLAGADATPARTDLTGGESLRVTIRVENRGQANAINVNLTVTPSNLPIVVPPPEGQSRTLGRINGERSTETTITYGTPKLGNEEPITFTASVTGTDENSEASVPSPLPAPRSNVITVRPEPDIFVRTIEVEKFDEKDSKLIGIDQRFDVKVTFGNRGGLARISTSVNDLNIGEPQYRVVDRLPPELEIPTGGEGVTTYRVTTIDGRTQSGRAEIRVVNLDITAVHTGQKVPFADVPGAPRASIEVQMKRPKVEAAFLIDANVDAKVNSGERLILTFDEPVKARPETNGEDFIIFPGGLNLKVPITVTSGPEARQITVAFQGDEPNLTTEGIEGIYQPGGEIAIGIGTVVATKAEKHIISEKTGNPPPDTKGEDAVDIDFEDKQPPEIPLISLSNEKVNTKPEIHIFLKDEQQGLDSGLADAKDFKYELDGRPLQVGVEINVTTHQPVEAAPVRSLAAQQTEKMIELIVTFLQPLSEGEHTFIITIQDQKGNESPPQRVTFTVSSPSEAIVDLATYPNPFAPGKEEKAVIRYVLSQPQPVTINIYDVAGRLVRTYDDTGREGINDTLKWDGMTAGRDVVGNGIYICELDAGETRKYWRIVVGPSIRRK
ncbi:T9SS type A sorting domain-containing protein, partial [Candidatus Poribacteria bacterium]|nr:T9SS type A sorting domain-containing protein [Candidatus Poribacteria bacterium]